MRIGPSRLRSWTTGALFGIVLLSVVASGCSDDGGSDEGAASTTAEPDASPSTSEAEERTTTTAASPALVLVTTTTTEPPATATTVDPAAPTTATPLPVRMYELDWSKLTLPPWFGYDDESNPDDPFWHLHNQSDEGFFLSLEMYTTGFGTAWTGETGSFELGCSGDGSGICIHFDPDGHGEEYGDLNADFMATGAIEITKLDEEGYDLTLSNVVFSDGATIPGPTRLRGDAPEAD